jgi:hypothetical protein
LDKRKDSSLPPLSAVTSSTAHIIEPSATCVSCTADAASVRSAVSACAPFSSSAQVNDEEEDDLLLWSLKAEEEKRRLDAL